MEPVVFRVYEEQDLEAMVELDRECFAPPFRFSSAAMRRFIDAENAWVIVAEAEKRIAGFLIVHREQAQRAEVGYVVTIDVDEGHRGRDIGQRMLRDGEAWVRGWNGAGMMLHVWTKNDSAIRFYERMGYGRVGVQRGFYGPGIDAAMYWKELTG
jgi:[ribosomal protein S18]-alanine N-acetyltransferase